MTSAQPAPASSSPATPLAAPDPAARAARAADVIRERTGVDRFDVAIVLGSGWGGAGRHLGSTIAVLDAGEVPGFHASPVPGHAGTLTAVRLPDGRHALLVAARTHFYQELGADAVAHPVRTAAALGAKVLVLTNGAGGIDPAWTPGTPVLISDHVNLTAATPLHGAEFADMTDAYAARLRAIARQVDPTLDEGVYAQFRGPQYETPAEVRMARALGADIVGMSTALETIAARACGLEVLGLSLITNSAAGVQDAPLSHTEVMAAGRAAEPRCSKLLADIVLALG